jgi:glycine C-acetyltransferase
MRDAIRAQLTDELGAINRAGTYKPERVMASPQGARVTLRDGRSALNLCANDYLGLANHPAIVEAAHSGLADWGFGLASVRFICGTQDIHKQLEERLSTFLGTADTILYSSCFDANAGLFETLLGADDVVISDALNHASIIDGIRLCKARRMRYANRDMDELERCLREAAGARRILVATDGVFSMDGYLAPLREICDLAERHGAMVMVDDSHAVGFMGAGGRGTPEHHDVVERIDVLTGTLGKALGGASGGYASGRAEIVELLRQRSRPYLFSNTIAPPIVVAALAALNLVESPAGAERRMRLRRNTRQFRDRLTELGFEVLPGEHPIAPVMFTDERLAVDLAAGLLELGIYVIPFSYPVVPKGRPRIRTQISATHAPEDLERAARAFEEARLSP